jgi:hypothetical protein
VYGGPWEAGISFSALFREEEDALRAASLPASTNNAAAAADGGGARRGFHSEDRPAAGVKHVSAAVRMIRLQFITR